MHELLNDVETFLAAHSMSPSKFGKEAMGDPNFVFELRKGREMLPSRERRVRDFMLTYRPDAA